MTENCVILNHVGVAVMFLTFSKIRQQADQMIELEAYEDEMDAADFRSGDSDLNADGVPDNLSAAQSKVHKQLLGPKMMSVDDEADAMVEAAVNRNRNRNKESITSFSQNPLDQPSTDAAKDTGSGDSQISELKYMSRQTATPSSMNKSDDAPDHPFSPSCSAPPPEDRPPTLDEEIHPLRTDSELSEKGDTKSAQSGSGTGASAAVKPADNKLSANNVSGLSQSVEECLPQVRANRSRSISRRNSISRSRRVSISGREYSRRGSMDMVTVELWRADVAQRFSWVPGCLWSFWYRQDPMIEPGSNPPVEMEPLQFDNSVGHFIAHPHFGNTINLCIVLNVVFMSMEYFEQPDSWTTMIEWAEVAFFFIFLGELIMKWIGRLPFPAHLLAPSLNINVTARSLLSHPLSSA